MRVHLRLFWAAWEKMLIHSVIVFYFPREILGLFHFSTTLSLIFLDKSLFFFSSSRHKALCFVYADKCQASLRELEEMPVIL